MNKRVLASRPEALNLKPAFRAHYEALLGDDFPKFLQSTQHYLTKAIRLNPLKNDPVDTKERLEKHFTLTAIPWCENGYWIEGERRDVGNTVEHQLGYCYIQEAASMLPPVVLRPTPGARVIDIAASPGSKTTQMSAMMENTGLLVANDRGIRLRPLGINVQKCGCRNVVITNVDGRSMKVPDVDFALADVPCSATGTLQRSTQAAVMWQERALAKLQSLQLQLARVAYAQLRPGGTMVYSTCTLEPLENEGVVSQMLASGAEILPIDLPLRREKPFTSFGDLEFDARVKNCLRIHPYTNDTEGFFVAHLRKPAV